MLQYIERLRLQLQWTMRWAFRSLSGWLLRQVWKMFETSPLNAKQPRGLRMYQRTVLYSTNCWMNHLLGFVWLITVSLNMMEWVYRRPQEWWINWYFSSSPDLGRLQNPELGIIAEKSFGSIWKKSWGGDHVTCIHYECLRVLLAKTKLSKVLDLWHCHRLFASSGFI